MEGVSQSAREEDQLPRPRVLFGPNTSSPKDVVGSKEKTLLKSSYCEEFDCFHMTIEHLDLHSKLRTARTYFLGRNQSQLLRVQNKFDDNVQIGYEFIREPNRFFESEQFLVQIYVEVLKAFQESMQQFSKDYRSLTEQFVSNLLLKKFEDANLPILAGQVKVDLKSYNAFGESAPIDFKDTISFKLTPVIYMLRLEVQEITQ